MVDSQQVAPDPILMRERMQQCEVQARSLLIDLSRLQKHFRSDPACTDARPFLDQAYTHIYDAQRDLTLAIDHALRSMAAAFADELPGIGGVKP